MTFDLSFAPAFFHGEEPEEMPCQPPPLYPTNLAQALYNLSHVEKMDIKIRALKIPDVECLFVPDDEFVARCIDKAKEIDSCDTLGPGPVGVYLFLDNEGRSPVVIGLGAIKVLVYPPDYADRLTDRDHRVTHPRFRAPD